MMKKLNVGWRGLAIATLLVLPLGCASTNGPRSAINPELLESNPLTQTPTAAPNGRGQQAAEGLENSIQTELAKLDQGAAPGDTYHRLAILCSQHGEFHRAEEFYRRALDHMAPNAEFTTDYGYSLALQGRFEQAEHCFRKTLELDPGATRARNNLGLVLAATGRHQEARAVFVQAGGESSADANLQIAMSWREQTDASVAGGLAGGGARQLAAVDQISLTSFPGAPQTGEAR